VAERLKAGVMQSMLREVHGRRVTTERARITLACLQRLIWSQATSISNPARRSFMLIQVSQVTSNPMRS
jgi:hypothetical protein